MSDRLISGRAARIRAGLALALLLSGTGVRAAPAATLAQLRDRLGRCAAPPGAPREAAGSAVTVLFSVRRDGSLQGRPRITHAHLTGTAPARRAFVAAALAAAAACFPLPITEGLGGAIAGRPLRRRSEARPAGIEAGRGQAARA